MSLLIDFQAVKQMLKDYKNEMPTSVSPPTLSLQEDVEPTPVAEQLPMSPGASGVQEAAEPEPTFLYTAEKLPQPVTVTVAITESSRVLETTSKEKPPTVSRKFGIYCYIAGLLLGIPLLEF